MSKNKEKRSPQMPEFPDFPKPPMVNEEMKEMAKSITRH